MWHFARIARIRSATLRSMRLSARRVRGQDFEPCFIPHKEITNMQCFHVRLDL